MPLRYTYRFRNGELALWELEEEDSFFLASLDLSEEEQRELSSLPFGKRRREWLAARYLLQLIDCSKGRRALVRLPSGRLIFAEGEGYCSLSHSAGWVAAVVSKKPVGVDVQRVEARIVRLSAKFMKREEVRFWEQHDHNKEVYTLYWAGKEAVYKAGGLRAVDFKGDIQLCLPASLSRSKAEICSSGDSNFDLFLGGLSGGECIAGLYKGKGQDRHLDSSWCLHYRLQKDMMLVMALPTG